MDDVDRLFFELVEALRRERTGRLREPLTVSDIYDRLVPYREVRDTIGFGSNGDYEAALTRLLAGERGYMLAEVAEVRQELASGLEERLPDTRRYRSFPDARFRVNPSEVPPPGHTRYAPPDIREEAARRADTVEPEAPDEPSGPSDVGAESESGAAESGSAAAGSESPAAKPASDEADTAIGSGEPAADERSDRDDPGEAWLPGRGSAAEEPAAGGGPAAASGPDTGACPRCEAGLPARPVSYCPHCGLALSRSVCAVCGADLEADWKFCGECGAPRR